MGGIFSKTCNSKVRLDEKTAIVTGCNTGIGKETVLEFYKRGARVVMACRDLEKARTAMEDIKKKTEGIEGTGEIVIKELDLGSFESVRNCANDILRTESKIHLLVNNAAIMAGPRMLSKDGYEMQFAVNHLGHFLFTLLLLPRIIRSAPARIVNVASIAHRYGGKMHFEDINLEKNYTPMGAYGRSKTANILFSAELARRLKGTGVNTYSLHPGVVDTELTRNLGIASPFLNLIVQYCVKCFMKSSNEGTQTTLYCSMDEKCGNETGLYYSDCAVATPNSDARNERRAQELWECSVKIVKLDGYDPFIPS